VLAAIPILRRNDSTFLIRNRFKELHGHVPAKIAEPYAQKTAQCLLSMPEQSTNKRKLPNIHSERTSFRKLSLGGQKSYRLVFSGGFDASRSLLKI
jgi:hypothetical protein